MERKPQQQTLSIRISDALREFLERSKQVISSSRGEQVSISDVAKTLLESAKDDRLDFRLEVADLQRNPTQALWEIRRKWENKHDLSRAEWIFLSQYVQVACEQLSGNAALPTPAAFAALLESVLAVRALRGDRGVGLDRYYLGNLGSQEQAVFNDRQLDPDLVPRLTVNLLQQLQANPSAPKPIFVGRNFYVAIRDEELPDIVALNRALAPHLEMLFRLAARGHWLQEHRPVISLRDRQIVTDSLFVEVPGFRLTFNLANDGNLSMLISMDAKDLAYPVSTYPEIREFASMLERVAPSEVWNGENFHASTFQNAADERLRFQFQRHRDGISVGMSAEEWECLKEVFAQAAKSPKLQKAYEELSLVYGEL